MRRAAACGDLMLGDDSEEAGRRPTFLVGLFGELWPQHLEAEQHPLVEQPMTRAVSTALFMRRLRFGGADETLISGGWGKLHHDLRHAGRIGREVSAQLFEVGQLAGVQLGGELTDECGLAAALVRQRRQINHEPAGFPSDSRSRKRSKVRHRRRRDSRSVGSKSFRRSLCASRRNQESDSAAAHASVS